MIPRTQAILVSILLVAFTTPFGYAAVSEQCRQETQNLQNDGFLDLVQNDLYQEFMDDYNEMCSISKFSCDLAFDGNNKTYVAACEDKGGQVVEHDVVLRCGVSIAKVNWDLGTIPTCIAKSCNASAVRAGELNDTRVDDFLNELKFTGCDAEFSGAGAIIGRRMWISAVVSTIIVVFVAW